MNFSTLWRCVLLGTPLLLGLGAAPLSAAQDGLSTEVTTAGGIFQAPSGWVQPFEFSSLRISFQGDGAPNLSFLFRGEALEAFGAKGLTPPWNLYPFANALSLEQTNLASSDGSGFYSLRLNRAALKWDWGPLETTAGLFKSDWGSAQIYRPTDYFFPLDPLALREQEPLGSEGLDASCFLFDDLSLEGAVRFLQGERVEEVLRLVNKGIGLTLTPSFASLSGRRGFGLETAITFPDFKASLEGVDWLQDPGISRVEWVAGLSTVREGTTYRWEIFKDATGQVLGSQSGGFTDALYLSFSTQGKFLEGGKGELRLLKSADGGPFLFWPRAQWDWEGGLSVFFEGQWRLGTGPVP